MMFHQAKIWLVDWTGLTRDALHIYVALALFIVIRLLWRGRFGTVAALCVVVAAALTGEWLDHQVEMLSNLPCNMAEHWHDLKNTVFAPLVLAVTLRWLVPRQVTTDAPMAIVSGDHSERGLEQP